MNSGGNDDGSAAFRCLACDRPLEKPVAHRVPGDDAPSSPAHRGAGEIVYRGGFPTISRPGQLIPLSPSHRSPSSPGVSCALARPPAALCFGSNGNNPTPSEACMASPRRLYTNHRMTARAVMPYGGGAVRHAGAAAQGGEQPVLGRRRRPHRVLLGQARRRQPGPPRTRLVAHLQERGTAPC